MRPLVEDGLARRLRAALVCALLVCSAPAAALAADSLAASGEAYPGVRVGGANVSGESIADISDSLRQSTGGNLQRYRFLVGEDPALSGAGGTGEDADGSRTVEFRPSEMGVVVRVRRSAFEAYLVGREGPILERLAERVSARAGTPHYVTPPVRYDESVVRSRIEDLAARVDRESENASVDIASEGDSSKGDSSEAEDSGAAPSVTVFDATDGRRVLRDRTLANFSRALSGLEREVEVPTESVAADIGTSAAEDAADAARAALSAPIVPVYEGPPQAPEVEPSAIAGALSAEPRPEEGDIAVSYDPRALASGLRESGAFEELATEPEEAEVYIEHPDRAASDGALSVRGGSPGLTPDLEAFAENVGRALFDDPAGERRVELPARAEEPDLSAGEAQELVPDAVIGSFEAAGEPSGDGEARRKNLEAAASTVDDTLLAPGEEFSMNAALAEASLVSPEDAAGAVPNAASEDSTAAEVGEVEDGGGVGQVASAVYGAALSADVLVTERHPAPADGPPPSYTDPSLEAFVGEAAANERQGSPAGEPGADLRLENGTGAYLRLRASASEDSVSVEIEGVSSEVADGAPFTPYSVLEEGEVGEPGESWQPYRVPEGSEPGAPGAQQAGAGRTYDYEAPEGPSEPEESEPEQTSEEDSSGGGSPDGGSPDGDTPDSGSSGGEEELNPNELG